MKRTPFRTILLALLISLALSSQAEADYTIRSPGEVANDTSYGEEPWVNPGNVAASDNSRAVADLNDWEESNYLKCTNYGFTIPSDAIINGIEVNIEHQREGRSIRDTEVKLVKAGVVQNVEDKAITGTNWSRNMDEIITYGGATALWSNTWAPAHVNAPDFGVVLAAIKAQTAGGHNEARVDHIQITIHYVVPGGEILKEEISAVESITWGRIKAQFVK